MRQNLSRLLYLLLVMLLATSCGEGASTTTDDETAEGSLTLSMVLASDGSTPTNTIRKGNPALVTALVKDADGKAASDLVVTFTTSQGVLNPSSGTALTDAAGKASIKLEAGSTVGADQITASATVGSDAVTASRGYQISAPDVLLGAGTPFEEGALELGLSSISAGGTTSVKARLVDSEGVSINFPVEVNFSSAFAELTPAGASIDSQVTSIAGVATATYTSTGTRSGTDTITATATIGGLSLSASVELEVLTAAAGSIEFVSATPTDIRLKGMGTETAVLGFRVIDLLGNPSPNQQVNFSLNTTVGGLAISPSSTLSNADGEVETTVQAGTMGTAVRVTAQLADTPSIQTQSEQLVVSTGIPDQDSFSLSIATFNPEAFNTDGVEVGVTVRAADRFNNPVPDGTAIYFTTEGGAIQPSCNTAGGECSVTWTSQSPRPLWLGAPDPRAADSPDGESFGGGGRVTILATAVGEESFLDLNGNGFFDDGDTLYDLPESFRDDNEDGVRAPFETFSDFNENGVYDAADGQYSGLLCGHSTLCADAVTTHVRDSGVIVMSTSGAHIEISPAAISLNTDATQSITVRVWDTNGNMMPSGTTISLATSTGSLQTASTFTVPNTSSLGPMSVGTVLKAGGTAETGTFTVQVTSPGGVLTGASAPITVTTP